MLCGCFPSLRRIANECINGKKILSKAEKAEELDDASLITADSHTSYTYVHYKTI